MPAIGAIANGDGRSTDPTFISSCCCGTRRDHAAPPVRFTMSTTMRQQSMAARAVLWLPPLAYMAVIFYLSSEPNPLPILTENIWDKAIHATEYGVLGILLCRAFLGEGLPVAIAGLWAFALTSVYGGSDEWHQFFTPGRNSDLRDWAADTTGAAIGVAVYAGVLLLVISTVSRRQRRLPR
jgi:VanZ family protein